MDGSDRTVRLPVDRVVQIVQSILERYGMSRESAAISARVCVFAERDGTASHGLYRLPGYIASLQAGYANGDAKPAIEIDSPCHIAVNGDNGFAQHALSIVSGMAVERARQNGMLMVGLRNCHHFGTLWADVEYFAERGLVAFSCVNSMSLVAPWGGNKAFYGTNPIAFAAPRKDGPPVGFDQASSVASLGDTELAARNGHKSPPQAGIDREGNVTDDPTAILDGGALLPFGGYKGGSVAMMVEFLAAGMTGGPFSYEVNATRPATAPTARTGQFLLLLDPRGVPGGGFGERAAEFVVMLEQAGGRKPGERRLAARADAEANGILLSRANHEMLKSYGDPEFAMG